MLLAATPILLLVGGCSPIPRPGAWHALGSVPGVSAAGEAFHLDGGRTLVIDATGSTAIFDAQQNHWTRAASVPTVFFGGSALRLRDGRILALGASFPSNGFPGLARAQAFLYLPAEDRWMPTTPPPMARQFERAVLLADGRVLVIGGVVGNGVSATATATCEIFDPSRSSWTPAASLDIARIQPAASVLGDGRVLVTGGFATTDEVFGVAFGPNQARPYDPQVYDPGRNRWSTHPFAVQVANPVLVPLSNGTVMATGGFDGRNRSHVTQLFDPRGNRWTMRAGNPGGVQPAVTLVDGRIAFLGGLGYAYDLGDDRWEPLTRSALAVNEAALLPDGRALAVSSPVLGEPPGATTSAIFDPAGFPALPGSTGPLASPGTFRLLAAIAAVLLVLVGARALWIRWRS
jgi:hypothetical protein